MIKNRKLAGFFLVSLFVLTLVRAEYPLVKDGQANASIIRLPKDDVIAFFGGIELRDYIERSTGVRLERTRQVSADRINVYIALLRQPGLELPAKTRALTQEIRDDGFVLYSDSSGVYVLAEQNAGLCYGVYELLKRYGNVRWISPGPEGEFVPKSASFVVPELAEVVNPSFKHRRFNLVSSWGSTKTPLWQLRNGMEPSKGKVKSIDITGKELGGHIFSTLLPDSLFPEHPELFCFYKKEGKRIPQCGEIREDPSKYRRGGQANQPCTSNQETVRIMQENLVKMLQDNPDAESFCILNNDSGKWCECENCTKLDPPDEAARGMVSTRFWLLANALIEAGKKVAPHLCFFSSPYQNFQEYPSGVSPDPRAEINFCLHHRCYLHSIGDPKCRINERYRAILDVWHKDGRNVQTYEYTNVLPRGEVWYLPLAPLLCQDLRYYHAIGNDGWCDEVAPYDGNYTTQDRTTTERWIGSALDIYLTANLLWNVNCDYEQLENEAGTLYYGAAWPAIRDYRKLLHATYSGINDHFIYGSVHWQLGRAFEEPGVLERLKEYLSSAEKAAKGDARVEKIVARDAEFFHLNFEKAIAAFRAEHLDNELRAGKRGNWDDQRWTLSDWGSVGDVPLKFQYDDEHLYLRHGAGGKGAWLTFVLDGQEKTFPAEEPGIVSFPFARKVSQGESCDVQISLARNDKIEYWQPGSKGGADNSRKVILGELAILRNGNFADFKEEKGRKIPRHFSQRGDLLPVTDGTAASGHTFLRGNGFIFQYLSGLTGPRQTYVTTEIFTGTLNVSLQCRGEGNLGIRLTTSALELIEEKKLEVNSPGQWQDMSVSFDCSQNKGSFLLIYFFVNGNNLDIDDLRITK